MISSDMRMPSIPMLGILGGIESILHHLRESGVLEDPGNMGTAHPSSEDMTEVTLVINDALQDDREDTLAVDELLSSLGQTEDGEMCAIHGPNVTR